MDTHLLLDQNDKDLEKLGITVNNMKQIALEIGHSLDKSDKVINELDRETYNIQQLLTNASKRLETLKQQSKNYTNLWIFVGLMISVTCIFYFVISSS
jgi:hypothetical protein